MGARTTWWATAVGKVAPLGAPLGWILVVPMALLAITQLFGLTAWRSVAVAQALTPYLLLPALPVAVVAFWGRQWALGATATAVVLVLTTLCWPLLFPPAQPTAAASAASLRVAHSNVLFHNPRLDEAVEMLLGSDADVLVVTEYSRRVEAAFLDSPLADKWPHRAGNSDGGAAGTAIWSRFPLDVQSAPDTMYATVVTDVLLPDSSTVRIAGVHPPTPTHDFDRWRSALDELSQFADANVPTVLAGDFNASWWHPGFRELLSEGFRDAHQVRGDGFSVSWPTNTPGPAFVRLDHALVTDDLVVDSVDDVDVPGSDHRGFEVTVRRAATTRG